LRWTLVHGDHFASMLDMQACAIDARTAGNQIFDKRGLAD
jgi:hypothetical protein